MGIAAKIKGRIKSSGSLEARLLSLKLAAFFKGKCGIEIGGPTPFFIGNFPVYKMVKHLDGCNFSNTTVWEGAIDEGNNYHYLPGKTGHQYITEASNLKDVLSGKYDFLLASHCLEHCANCLKTLKEWVRVIKPGGYLLLILPDKRFTFDHNRETTSFDHLLQDLEKDVDETDLTHLEEIITKHDLAMDTPAGDINQFRKRSEQNFANRCLHHHVFDTALLLKVCSYFELKIKYNKWIAPYHQVIIAQKPVGSKRSQL